MIDSASIASDQSRPCQPIGRGWFAGQYGLLLLAWLAMVVPAAAADPEIIRLWVPAQDVSKRFPPGTALRRLSAGEFDTLVEAAVRDGAERRAIEPPRLIRARHRARWNAGILSGRTELVLESRAAGPSEFVLDSWTPTFLATAQTAPTLGARDSGEATVWIDPSPREQTLILDWELQARPHSRGRGFLLGLPGTATTVLELEIPQGWVASSRRGVRRGPLPLADPARRLWEIDGGSGRFDLELRDPRDPEQEPSMGRSSAWLSGTTEIDLRRTTNRAGDLVNWTTDWRLERDPAHHGRLEVELDPGLELIDVQGPSVRGYRLERSGPAPRVSVALDGTARTAGALRFLAHAQVPSEGPWTVPAMRPLDATWTGGRTRVILDDSHLVRECREKAGRLIVPAPGAARPANQLVFEAESPRAVAELVFLPPRADLSCAVRGRLVIGSAQARFDCRLDWRLAHGSTPELELDLSPGWIPDQVQIPSLDEPVSWHSSVLPSGATRLRVLLPAAILARREGTLTLGASSTAPGGRGLLELPRVRAASAAMVDEAWLAWVDEGTLIRPAQARGLAWIDPAEVPGLLVAAPGPNYREGLAWRWTAAQARARLERQRIDQHPRAAIRARARVGTTGRELSLEGTLRVSAGAAAVDSVPLELHQPGDPFAAWRFRDEDGGELALRPLEAAARARLGFPAQGSARSLVVNPPGLTEKTLRFQAALPWSSPGSVPLLCVPPDYLLSGTILIETPAGMSSRAEASGLGRLNPAVADLLGTGRDPEGGAGTRADRSSAKGLAVHAFQYTHCGGKLVLDTEPLVPAPAPGILREAVLTTSVDIRGHCWNRLRLLVQLEQARALELVMPPRSALVRVRRDGSDVAPIRSGSHLSIEALGLGPGVRSSRIVLDYVSEGEGIADGGLRRPDLPAVNLPCLSFVWEIVTPPTWKAVDCGPGLIADDRDAARWPTGALGLWKPAWNFLMGPTAHDDGERLRALDAQLLRPSADELTCAEWFSRWDSGAWPVVIDRLALHSTGLGPKSPCLPGRVKTDRGSVSLATLHQHGLAMIGLAGALLITTESEAPRFGQPERWAEAIAETLAWGSDGTDRFQAVTRWRGETSPRAAAAPAAGDETGEGIPPRPGWSTWRFSAGSWPGSDSFVHLINVRSRILTGWMLIVLLVPAWLAVGRRFAGGRLLIPAVLAAACVLIDLHLPARWSGVTAAGFTAAVAVLILDLGGRPWPAAAPRRPAARSGSSILRRVGSSAVGAALLLGLAGASATLGAAPTDADAPILALFPYEGPFDPNRPPDQVLLTLSDYTRLSGRTGARPAPPWAAVTALSALHRVARRDAQNVIVDSEFELLARGRGPFAWRVPVSLARDIEAALDGKAVPIAIEPGGTRAEVLIAEAGSHRLHLRRSAAARLDEAGAELLRLPINALPSARIIVEAPGDRIPQGELEARGRTELQPNGTLVGRLGPAQGIALRWTKPGPPAVHPALGSVEGLILWDVTPAGDRLRARLTYHQTQEISTLRIAHDPGLVLRSVHTPGQVDVAAQDDAGTAQWLLFIDPPLPAGTTVDLDCWRARDAARSDAGESGRTSRRAKGWDRRLPRIQPVGVERFTGILGVRRPGDWTGRLEPLPDTEPINDESFVQAWGSLPEEPLTLCGTSRFARDFRATLRTGPSPSRIQVRPAAQLQIESGRIALSVDAELIESSGHLPFLAAELPEDLQITSVAGEGLADWTVSADRRLHLIWDRKRAIPRPRIRISGWIPLSEDPLRIGSRPRRIPTPWIGWGGAEGHLGTLAITAPVQPEIRGAAGLTRLPAESEPGGSGGSPAAASRLGYRVDDPQRLGDVAWESKPPRVRVSIESQMTLYPNFAQWVAVLRYDVARGALEAVHLKMPAAWAAQGKLDLSGEEAQLTRETRGPSSFWSIVPRRPIWGSHRFVFRSMLPLGADREIVHPEIAPLGPGTVEAYLGIVNATGLPLTSEGSTGLQPIAYGTKFQAQEFPRDAGAPDRAFRVEKEGWALRIQLPRTAIETNGSREDAARVALADLMLAVGPDRSLVGRGVFETVPDSGRLLTVELPEGSSLLWASVDSNPAVPLRSAPGVWSIVLDDRRSARVCLVWTTRPVSAAAPRPGGWSIALPKAGAGPSRTLLTVSTPAGVRIEGISGGLEPATMAGLEMARAAELARTIGDLLPGLDRSSGRDHERLVSLLIHHELALRGAERSIRWSGSGTTRARGGRADQDLESIATARRDLVAAVQSAGLPDDLASARNYLGQSPAQMTGAPIAIPEPSTIDRIRAFGRPTAFQGIMTGIDEPSARSTLTFGDRPQWAGLDPPTARAGLIAALVLGAAIAATALGRHRGIHAAALALVLGGAGSAGGPVMLAGGLGLAAVAWRTGRA